MFKKMSFKTTCILNSKRNPFFRSCLSEKYHDRQAEMWKQTGGVTDEKWGCVVVEGGMRTKTEKIK